VVRLGLVGWLAARRAVRPLGEALATQRAFVSDASHELRTPLTALSSRIQLLQRRQARDEPTAELITDLRRDVQIMDDVLTDMLLAAEGASSTDAACDVARALARAIDTLVPLANDAGVTLRTGPTVARARIQEITLARLCVALLDNAVQHSPRGGEVDVTVDTDPQHVEIRVADRGPGIDPAHRERVFERFARSGEAGRRRGFGLGLALVREAATRYGGTVTIAETSPRGTVFALRLPSA
jgi:signal transduction histidine kinase